MNTKILLLVSLLCSVSLPGERAQAAEASAEPVMECHTTEPTADKPQSKVWYAAGQWWAWLPSGPQGSLIWRRSDTGGWKIEPKLAKLLEELPARADVYAVEEKMAAALVEGNRLAVISMFFNEDSNRYVPIAPPLEWEETGEVETVTIDRDAAGFFWVAYAADSADTRRIMTRIIPPDFSYYGPPVVLARDVSQDDICVVQRMNGAIGVLWSNQNTESILYTRHQAGTPVGEWLAADTVARGGKTADDHLNFTKPGIRLRNPGEVRLFAATKTSLDQIGKPLLAARVFSEEQEWTTVEFAELTTAAEPSRPVALWLGDHPAVAYTVYGDDANHIELQHFARDGQSTAGKPEILLGPIPGLNNVTGPKFEPRGVPTLLLASDNEGRVWEIFVERGSEIEGKSQGPGGGSGGGGGTKN